MQSMRNNNNKGGCGDWERGSGTHGAEYSADVMGERKEQARRAG